MQFSKNVFRLNTFSFYFNYVSNLLILVWSTVEIVIFVLISVLVHKYIHISVSESITVNVNISISLLLKQAAIPTTEIVSFRSRLFIRLGFTKYN